MKYKRNHLKGFLFSIIFILLSTPKGYSSSLKFSIVLEKNEFTLKEPINVNLKLENKGKNPVYVNKRFYISTEDLPKEKREVYFIVISPSGNKLPCKFRYETGLPKTDYFVLLNPKEEVVSEWKRDLRNYFDFSEPGEYKISAVYENSYGEEIGLETFREKLVSEPVIIKIKE